MGKKDTCATYCKPVAITGHTKTINQIEIFKTVQAGTPLEQGDILYLCPYLYPVKIDLVLVCPIWEINNYYQSCAERFMIDNSYLGQLKGNKEGFKYKIKNTIGNAIAGKEARYTVLKGANLPEIKTEPWLVDFGNTYTLPLGFLDNFSKTDENNKCRLRLDTEYRVDLIAKFNYFLLRAFLPKESRVEYANLKADFDEEAVDKILRGEE